MSDFSRRKFINAGLAAAAGVSGIAVATKVAEHHGLIPPDAGETLRPGRNADLRGAATLDPPFHGP